MILHAFRKDGRSSTLHQMTGSIYPSRSTPDCSAKPVARSYQLNQEEAEEAHVAGAKICGKCFPCGLRPVNPVVTAVAGGLLQSQIDGLSTGALIVLQTAYDAGGVQLRDAVLASLRSNANTPQAAAARALATQLNPTRTETCA